MAGVRRDSGVLEILRQAAASVSAGQWRQARRLCRAVLLAEPHNARALHLLGAVASCQGRLAVAEDFLRQAIAIEPRNSAWLRDLGIVLAAGGNWTGALASLTRSLVLNPGDAVSMRLKATALWESGHVRAALAAFQRWAEFEPAAVRAWLGAAHCLRRLGKLPEASRVAHRVLEVEPDSVAGHQLLAEIHSDLHQHEDTLRHRVELVRLLPGDPSAVALCAVAHYEVGETPAAVALFRTVLKDGLSAELHAAYLTTLLHDAGSTAELLSAEHERWARIHGVSPGTEARNTFRPATSRRLRIAYLCGEPATSAIFRFLAPLLRNHDRRQFAVSLYCTDASLDGRADRCGVTARELKVVSGLPWRSIAERMRREGTDILVNFSGHYGDDSILVTAQRTAPVQVSFPHYPCSTGIPQMDHIFTDRWTCPPGQERQYSERPYLLDSGYLVCDPPQSARLGGTLPAGRNGSVTFGIFQRAAKLSARVWDAIADILRKVEKSSLLVHHASAELDAPECAYRRRLANMLSTRGVDPGRMRFRGIVEYREHIRLLSSVDIALDSFPYTGTTTTFDCLWMGVPVVTLVGNTHVSRASAGLLMRLGLEEFVARNVCEYAAIAVRTAGDLGRLESLRGGLRRKVRASTLIDGARLAREVEDAYRWMSLTRS